MNSARTCAASALRSGAGCFVRCCEKLTAQMTMTRMAKFVAFLIARMLLRSHAPGNFRTHNFSNRLPAFADWHANANTAIQDCCDSTGIDARILEKHSCGRNQSGGGPEDGRHHRGIVLEGA